MTKSAFINKFNAESVSIMRTDMGMAFEVTLYFKDESHKEITFPEDSVYAPECDDMDIPELEAYLASEEYEEKVLDTAMELVDCGFAEFEEEA